MLALLSWLEQGAMRATYRPSDPLFFGALLSIGPATVLLPSWGARRDGGHRIAEAYLRSTDYLTERLTSHQPRRA
jgi:hypothetical protein